MTDKYIYGAVSRISPEAPIPVLNVQSDKMVPGGAANVASNISSMLLDTTVFGRVGRDVDGRALKDIMASRNIKFGGVESETVPTITKTRVVGMNQQIVRIDVEDTREIEEPLKDTMLDLVSAELEEAEVVIISDYNKGVCTNEVCNGIISMAHERGKKVLVDSKVQDWIRYAKADLVTPNFKEFCEAIGMKCANTEEDIVKYGMKLCQDFELGGLLVTRSQYGMTYVNAQGEYFTFPADAQEVYDVSGAGDTVIATIGTFLAIGVELKEAIYAANVAAGIAVSKFGTYNVSAQELFDVLEQKNNKKVLNVWSWEEAALRCKKWIADGEKVIFTNGCFDILHKGHVTYLNAARNLGDRLIIGVNTDASVKRLKGEERPVNGQDDRAFILSCLACVDGVVLFDEDTPYELIKMLRPNVIAKGGDYKLEDVVGRDLVEEVALIPFVEGYSTTKIIEVIR